MSHWRRLRTRRLQDCRVFHVNEVHYQAPHRPDERSFYVVEAPDWINVIARTPDDLVVLVRQFRFGTEELTLEIPGGMIDEGESPLDAARRELVEETGYRAEEWQDLGWVHPNPAVQNNRCHTFLADSAVRVAEPTPDPDEHIDVLTIGMDEVPGRIAAGEIRHSLVISAFRLLELQR